MKSKDKNLENKYVLLSHTFDPIYDINSKILILGTFPSVKSRETNFYYGNPQNRFWKVISFLTNSDLPNTIEEKRELLIKNKIAIWDVVKECEIIGSDDKSIRNIVLVDLSEIINTVNLTNIYANGNKAKELYNKFLKHKTNKEIITLPSTSPANARYSFDALIEKWKEILVDL